MRALIVIRLSNLTDETTSPQRQREVCERYCTDRDWSVVGIAEDLDVSASTTKPFDRPSLRPWLERPRDYDVIVFWRVDRLVRKVAHLAVMIEWSEEHNVNLVSATESHFDLSTPFGRAIAYFVGIFAEMEAGAISERTKQTYAHNVRAGKYRGGHPPFGYRPVKVKGEWRLELDPVTSELARSIVERTLEGERPTTICRDLNNRGVPTSQDHFRKSQGQPVKGWLWRTSNLKRELRSPTLLGRVVEHPYVIENGRRKRVPGEPKLLLGADGSPIVRAEPVIDLVTFQRLQKALDSMSGTRSAYKKSEALCLRVVYCGVCGNPMYLRRGRTTKYYACSSASLTVACGNLTARREDLDKIVTSSFLMLFGDIERMHRVYDPGADAAVELAEVDAELVEIAGTITSPAFRSGPAREAMDAKAEALAARREALVAAEYRPAGYRYEPTGQTFRQHWETLTDQGRNQMLRDMRARVDYRRDKEDKTHIDISWGDLDEVANAVVAG